MPSRFSDAQQRHLYHGIVYLEKQLGDIEAILDSAGRTALFPRYSADVSTTQRMQLEAGIAAIRATIASLMQREELAPEAAQLPAMQAIRSHLTFAEIAAEDLGPRNMRGYGELDASQAVALDHLVAELRSPIASLLSSLGPQQVRPSTSPPADPATLAHCATVIAQLAAGAPGAIAAMADALTAAFIANPALPGDELPMIALDALTAFMLAARDALALRIARPLPAPEIESLAWRLDKPRLASLGANYINARFRRQLDARSAAIAEALRSYATRLERALT